MVMLKLIIAQIEISRHYIDTTNLSYINLFKLSKVYIKRAKDSNLWSVIPSEKIYSLLIDDNK